MENIIVSLLSGLNKGIFGYYRDDFKILCLKNIDTTMGQA